MKNYTYITVLLFAIFILFCQQTIAQEKEKLSNHPENESLINLGNNMQSGKIHLTINEQAKGKSTLKTQEYQVCFYRTGEIINIWKSEEKAQKHKKILLKKDGNLSSLANSHYNILNVTDSMQYVYNGKTWYVIDHKNKTCEIDTVWCEVACSYPFLHPDFMIFSSMIPFYIQGWLKLSIEEGSIENIEKKGDTTILKIEREGISSKRGRNNRALYAEKYVWNEEKSVLLLHEKVLKNKKDGSERILIMEEMKLLDAYLNDEKYANPELYNGLNYAKSYRISYAKYSKKKHKTM